MSIALRNTSVTSVGTFVASVGTPGPPVEL